MSLYLFFVQSFDQHSNPPTRVSPESPFRKEPPPPCGGNGAVLRPREAQRSKGRTVIVLTRNHTRWMHDSHDRVWRTKGALYFPSLSAEERRSYITSGIRREKRNGEKKVKGNGKRETRIQGRKAEGLKSINFKRQSRRLTVITLVAGTFASRIRHQRRQRDLHSSSQCCWDLECECETPKEGRGGDPEGNERLPRCEGCRKRDWCYSIFEFEIS